MAEESLDLRALDRAEAYRTLTPAIERTLEGLADRTTAMATIAAMVHHAFGHLWTGFYCVAEPGRLLRVGPYQGTLGCLEIAFGRGVCGTAAVERRTVVVPDVHAFPGHIACDGRSRSEIVLPVFDGRGELIAVFDVDSAEPAAFDERDAAGLRQILSWFERAPSASPDAETLLRTREVLHAVEALAHLGTFEWDAIAGTTRWSDELYAIIGLSPGVHPAGTASYAATVHPEQFEAARAHWLKVCRGEQDHLDYEHSILRHGEERIVHMRGRAERGPDGRIARLVGIVQDITAARRLERQLAISDRLSSLGRLAAGVAHEINNPLAYVLSNVEAMQRRVPGLIERLGRAAAPAELDALKEQRELMREVRVGVERVAAIVRDLKTLARVPGDSRQLFPLSRAIDFAVTIAGNELKHRARLEREDRPAPKLFANEARVGQLVLNLVLNAIEAIPEGRASQHRIRITTGPTGDGRLVLEVQDTGRGIPSELAGRVFDPFFTTRRVGAGLGLGLSICHGIVSELGGTIDFTSEPSRGTTFRVVLPAGHELPVERSPAPPPPPPRPEVRPSLLVIDDEPGITNTVSRLLRRHYEVTAVHEGQRALGLLTEGARFDLILCDLMMPDLSGMDLYERVLALRPAVAERFLFLSGGAFSTRAVEFLERMADRSIDKPFDHATLDARLRRLYADVGAAPQV